MAGKNMGQRGWPGILGRKVQRRASLKKPAQSIMKLQAIILLSHQRRNNNRQEVMILSTLANQRLQGGMGAISRKMSGRQFRITVLMASRKRTGCLTLDHQYAASRFCSTRPVTVEISGISER